MCRSAPILVGRLYNPARTRWPEATQYSFRGGTHELVLFWGKLDEATIDAVRYGDLALSVFESGPLVLLLYCIKETAEDNETARGVRALLLPALVLPEGGPAARQPWRARFARPCPRSSPPRVPAPQQEQSPKPKGPWPANARGVCLEGRYLFVRARGKAEAIKEAARRAVQAAWEGRKTLRKKRSAFPAPPTGLGKLLPLR
jgi:hypothetical protein